MKQKVIIYGGSGGIGYATGKLLRERGYDLHLVGRSKDKLALSAAELEASYTVGDVTEPGLFVQVAQDAGNAVSGLVYAVGTVNLRSLQRLTEADFLNDFRVNAAGAALAVQAALPAFKRSEGPASVVLFSSVAALQGFSLHASVGMAKGAVMGLTLSLAAELAPKVRVNAIAPSITRTPLVESMLANEQMSAAIAGLHAMQRLGTANDIASLAAFLLSPDADWITGQVISVDGGRSTLRTKN